MLRTRKVSAGNAGDCTSASLPATPCPASSDLDATLRMAGFAPEVRPASFDVCRNRNRRRLAGTQILRRAVPQVSVARSVRRGQSLREDPLKRDVQPRQERRLQDIARLTRQRLGTAETSILNSIDPHRLELGIHDPVLGHT